MVLLFVVAAAVVFKHKRFTSKLVIKILSYHSKPTLLYSNFLVGSLQGTFLFCQLAPCQVLTEESLEDWKAREVTRY